MAKIKYMPKSIFKYRKVDLYSIENLRNEKIWLASPKDFNDPYDCSVYLDIEKTLKEGPKQFDSSNELIDPESKSQIKDDDVVKVSDHLANTFKICSFYERVDSMLMWEHYADEHRGFCIEYDVTEIDSSKHYNLFPVIYSDQMFDATNHYIKVGVEDDFSKTYLTRAAISKAKDWAYEKEWRLVAEREKFESDEVIRKCLQTLWKAKAVYLGSRMKPANEEILVNLCKEKGITPYRMQRDISEFCMDSQPYK
jgi:Protein of unknown function (DUF2971)